MIPAADRVQTPAQYGAVAPSGEKWPLNGHDTAMYGVNRVYPTVQGEGGQVGTPMTIVRLQGCPVSCHFCDTPESWALPERFRHAAEIAAIARQYPPNWALVTGGEPCWYMLQPLTEALHKIGMSTALETSGVYPITGGWDWITVSPKPAGRLPLHEDNLKLANEIKWVIGRREDIADVAACWEQYHDGAFRWSRRPRFSLQPMSASKKATQLCLDALMEYPDWFLSVQVHKILQIA